MSCNGSIFVEGDKYGQTATLAKGSGMRDEEIYLETAQRIQRHEIT